MISKQRGFSLVEVMIAICLVGVGALGLVKMQAYIEQRSDYAYHSIQALGLAEAKLEWFRTRGADSTTSEIPVADFDTDIVAGSDNHPLTLLIGKFLPLPWMAMSKRFKWM